MTRIDMHHRLRILLAFFWQGVVPVCLPPGSIDAYLCAIQSVPHPLRKKEVHFVQRLHQRLPSGY